MGSILACGVAYTIGLFHKLNVYTVHSRYLEATQLTGAVLLIMGSSITSVKGITSPYWPWIFLPVLISFIGASLLVFPFSRMGYLFADRETLLQAGIISASIVLYSQFTASQLRGFVWGTLVVGTLILMMLMIKIPLSLRINMPLGRCMLRLASWILVLHSWVRYYGIEKSATCPHYWIMLLYLSALLMWLYSVVMVHWILSRWL